jgi:PAS domain S-box-containing protein
LIFFHELAVLAVNGSSLSALLVQLRDHLQAGVLTVGHSADRPPVSDRLIMVPLQHRGHYLGDLYLDLLPGQDSTAVAGRLALFSPLIAMLLASSTLDDGASAGNGESRQVVLEERDRLEAVLESTNDAILMTDPNGIIVLATLQFETFTGIQRYGVLGLPIEQLVRLIESKEGLPATLAHILNALASNPTDYLGGEFEVFAPQRRVLVWYSLPVNAQSGTRLGRIFAFRDATRERELDRMKTEFITLVSHELRTPLTSVKGFSDLILEVSPALDDDTIEYLKIIGMNADRLIALINDILDVTRIESDRVELSPALCPMKEVIWQVVTSMQPMLDERGHRLVLDLEPYLPPVWADPSRMIQILSNLLSNAIKYTLKPGVITVQARSVQSADALPPAAPRDQIVPCVMVAIQDTGLGIAAQDLPQLFQRFYRTNSEASRLVGGTGLGLTIVKSFVEMHGGQVWVESTPGEGSIFAFTIPVVERRSPSV